ncbi:Metallo-dependent phosphatase [Dothidotthia symphoricarpi CBS 119687]|uniref:Metallo-dependent phosphatase n=1 Tax=Dothidotthia symphoricarpi CBS 119687 TaxID=1392245 RepID=A0A6A6AAG8_9PLEO|nr:Metallo-dependent phosphatase [Dothidotthia symphoricarpi CBS 119687]KAF2127868.1 Metallo-dependent phosphatase [Dothidotthia symphoricarpi CBS 119687]
MAESGQSSELNYPGLRFGADKKFSITVFSDLHFGEPTWARNRPYADPKTIGVMYSVIDNEQPDMVVLNGDLTSCEFVAPENSNALIDQMVSPLVNRNLPFAATFGNHDMSKTCSTRSTSEYMWDNVKGKNGKKLSFTTSSVPGAHDQVGTSNYYVPVYSSSGGDNPSLEMMLWFFDSKGGRVFNPTGDDIPVGGWVDEKVVSWFRDTRDGINQQHNRVIPSLAFVHIPVQGMQAFQKHGGRTSTTEPGLNEELVGHQGDVCDSSGNNCNYNGADGPFMKALVETQGLMGVFSGHDHGIDWCMKWAKNLPTNPTNGNGVNFCFNRHSGYGGYTDWTRGARQIVVDEDKLGKSELETWIRLEDGSVSGHVTLNSTYGVDQYPQVQKLKSSGP